MNPLSDDYRAGYEEGVTRGWMGGYMQACVEWASACGPDGELPLTVTEKRGVQKVVDWMIARRHTVQEQAS